MNNIYLIYEPNTNGFGIETYLREFLKCFTDDPEYIITIISTQSSYNKITIEKRGNNLRYVHIPSLLFSGKNYDSYYRNILFILSGYIQEKTPIFFFHYKEQMKAFKYVKMLFPFSKTVFAVHYLGWPFLLKGDFDTFRSILKKKENQRSQEEKRIYDLFKEEQKMLAQQELDAVVTLSHFTHNLLINEYRIPEKKLFLIPNGLSDNYEELSTEKRNLLRKNYSLGKKDKVLLYVGRLEATKGILDLLKAFEIAAEKEKNLKLIIAGEGDFNTCLQYSKRCGNKIIYTAKVDQQELLVLYRIADAGVIPSYHEQCSYVAIEMMMHGLPILVSDGIGLEEMFTDKKNGKKYLLKEQENNPSYLSDVIMDFVKEDKINYQKEARKKYLDSYSSDVMKSKITSMVSHVFTEKES